MDIALDAWPHPITSEGRVTVFVADGTTLDQALIEFIPPGEPAVAVVDGRLIARAAWARTILREGQIVQARVTVGDNPIAAILTIAVLIAAPYAAAFLAPSIAGALGIGVGVATTGLTALIGAGGLLIVNALFPPRLPDSRPAGTGGQPDPQYTLSGGANRARPHEPLILLLGSHRVFPDIVAREYTDFDDEGDQYLNQIFDFGIGNLSRSETGFGETLVSDFDDIETQADVDAVTLVAGNVDTINGGELENVSPRNTITRTTEPSTTRLAFDIVSQDFFARDDGSLDGYADVGFRLRWEPVGGGLSNIRNVTISTPDGAEARNAVRRSFSYDVPEGEYDVSVQRRTGFSADQDLTRVTSSSTLVAIRAYQDDTADFSGRNPLAIRAKATGQLYGRLEAVNAVVDQLIPVWNGAAWVADQVTSNPAWIYRAYLKGWREAGRLTAGMGLPDARIDEDAIKAWGAFCDAEGLGCDFPITDRRDHAAVLKLITQCGWGSPDLSSGKWGILWEDSGRPVTALITPANIVGGSLSMVYDNEGLADEIIGTYIDRDSGYEQNTLRRTVPGIGTPERPVTIPLEGITRGEHAAKELNRTAAAQFYHQRAIAWEMPEEGFFIARGDVVGLSHDLIGGSIGGRLVEISASRLGVTVGPTVDGPGSIWITGLDGECAFDDIHGRSVPGVRSHPRCGASSPAARRARRRSIELQVHGIRGCRRCPQGSRHRHPAGRRRKLQDHGA